jgi:glycosyltransferase involved in cell wall biosynthesis
MKYKLSVIVACYNMKRELPRTLETLMPYYQRDIAKHDYEIIVVDNGSAEPVSIPAEMFIHSNLRLDTVLNAQISPVVALNNAIEKSSSEFVAVLIDGARMLSPGFLAAALDVCSSSRYAIGTAMAYHLGPGPQSITMTTGYCQAVEDKLLKMVDWRSDGYELFTISEMASSSGAGMFEPLSESNSIVLSKSFWNEIGGFDEEFKSAGGGLANLDLYKRLCEHNETKVYMLFAEGSFHQFHGGVSTNTPGGKFEEFHKEYVKIRGVGFSKPNEAAITYGKPSRQALRLVAQSVTKSIDARKKSNIEPPNRVTSNVDDKNDIYVFLGLLSISPDQVKAWVSTTFAHDLSNYVFEYNREMFTSDEMSGYYNLCLPKKSFSRCVKTDQRDVLANGFLKYRSSISELFYDPFICRQFDFWEPVLLANFQAVNVSFIISKPEVYAVKQAESIGLSYENALLFWFYSYMDAEKLSRTSSRKCLLENNLLASEVSKLQESLRDGSTSSAEPAVLVEDSSEADNIYGQFYNLLSALVVDDGDEQRQRLDEFYLTFATILPILNQSLSIYQDISVHKNEVIVGQHLRLEELLITVDRYKNSIDRYANWRRLKFRAVINSSKRLVYRGLNRCLRFLQRRT